MKSTKAKNLIWVTGSILANALHGTVGASPLAPSHKLNLPIPPGVEAVAPRDGAESEPEYLIRVLCRNENSDVNRKRSTTLMDLGRGKSGEPDFAGELTQKEIQEKFLEQGLRKKIDTHMGAMISILQKMQSNTSITDMSRFAMQLDDEKEEWLRLLDKPEMFNKDEFDPDDITPILRKLNHRVQGGLVGPEYVKKDLEALVAVNNQKRLALSPQLNKIDQANFHVSESLRVVLKARGDLGSELRAKNLTVSVAPSTKEVKVLLGKEVAYSLVYNPESGLIEGVGMPRHLGVISCLKKQE